MRFAQVAVGNAERTGQQAGTHASAVAAGVASGAGRIRTSPGVHRPSTSGVDVEPDAGAHLQLGNPSGSWSHIKSVRCSGTPGMRARCAGRCTTRRPLHATQSSVTQSACPTGCNKPVGRWCAEARARDATAALAELGTPAFGPDAEKGTVEASTGVILPGTTEPAATVELVLRTSGMHVRVKEHRALNTEECSGPYSR